MCSPPLLLYAALVVSNAQTYGGDLIRRRLAIHIAVVGAGGIELPADCVEEALVTAAAAESPARNSL